MIIPFVFTLDTMGNGRPLTWVFNKAVSFCQKQKWPVIAQKQYFESYNEDWNSSSESAEYFEYDVPQPIYLERIESVVIPQKIESDFIKKFPSQVDAYMASVRCEWQESETEPVCLCRIKETVERVLGKCFLKRAGLLLHIHTSSDKNVAEFITKQGNR